ncbi:acetyl-CoA hydrolase/transferase family protein [Fusibacter ferrireducens]|uniref:4-hydroxybutyrate--acetyl-CoA CoA transferase n=1 Tax=Fusibacter ferrireducens TaxID=2785058 RepID=A0ABR9ZU91_9FIRM|nr:acetyl-CoA hydrolase/transferase C-terminal domain-containing protein [Fusibacter ferrireducens]MBF4693526.1 4-hydroxybutyrate--acetyl-CoA CoA transferase [Fusibacter ferrireducens]
MEKLAQLYREKVSSLESFLDHFKDQDFIVVGLGGSEPMPLMNELHKLYDKGIRGCQLSNTLPMGDYPLFNDPKYSESVRVNGWFYTGPLRKNHPKGHLSFQPQHLHRALDKRLVAMAGRRKVLMTTAASMDEHGYFSLSIGNTYEMQLIRTGEVEVVLEVSPHFPRTFGDNQVHVSDVAVIVETDRMPPLLPVADCSEKDEAIGQYISELIEDGSTIQLGIGGIPNAVAKALVGKKNLGIHTEMFTDGMIDLLESGAVNNKHKTLYPDKTICTFALGTERLYQYLHNNPSVWFMPGRWTNDPYVIGQNDNMVSINTTIEIDLTGQCCSESMGYHQFSGTGGQADTAIGAQYSKNGKSFITLYSTAMVKQPDGSRKCVSKIVPTLKDGAVVTLSRNDVDYVVTEFGVAALRGQTIGERAKRLIAIAHPDFRAELERSIEAYQFY